MKLKLELDRELADALYASAERELRYPHQQVEVLLRQALGLPFPVPDKTDRLPSDEHTGQSMHAPTLSAKGVSDAF
jgi:hypothetical protein